MRQIGCWVVLMCLLIVPSGTIRPWTELQTAVADEQPPRRARHAYGSPRRGCQFVPNGATVPAIVVPSFANLHELQGTPTAVNPRGFQQARSF